MAPHELKPADHKLKTAAGFSELWDGATIKRVRAGEGSLILPGRRLAMHLLVQPSAAAQFFSDPVLRDQGLLSRILVAAPDSIAGTRLYRDVDPADDAAIRVFGARLLDIIEAPWPLAKGTRNELEPPALTIEPENAALQKRAKEVDQLRAAGKPTLPTTIGIELETNPFLRPHVAAIQKRLGMEGKPEWQIFGEIRERKNRG